MAFDYSSIASNADALITDFGRLVTLVTTSRVPIDADKPWLGNTVAETSTTAKMVFTHFSTDEIDGTLVMRTDVMGLVAEDALAGFDITEVDRVEDGTTVYGVLDILSVEPGSTALVHTLHLRR